MITKEVSPYRKAGREFTKGVVDTLINIFIILVIVSFPIKYFNEWAFPTDSTDVDKFHRSGFVVMTDNKTGIEYLVTKDGAIIRRGQ